MFDDVPLSSAAQELKVDYIPPDTFTDLKKLQGELDDDTSASSFSAPPPDRALLPTPAARLGEAVRPDANVRPSPGRYDGVACIPGRGGWLGGDGDKPPGVQAFKQGVQGERAQGKIIIMVIGKHYQRSKFWENRRSHIIRANYLFR